MTGAIEQRRAPLRVGSAWQPRLPAYGHVHPFLRRAGIAKTVLFLPHPDVEVSRHGRVGTGGASTSRRARGRPGAPVGLQARHALGLGCTAATSARPRNAPDTFVDGVSVFVPRFGRELGPNTPVVARVGGADLLSISPLAVQRNDSDFDLEGLDVRGEDAAAQARRHGDRAPRGPRRRHLPRPRRRAGLLLQHGGGRHAPGGLRALRALHRVAQGRRAALRPARALRVRAARADRGC